RRTRLLFALAILALAAASIRTPGPSGSALFQATAFLLPLNLAALALLADRGLLTPIGLAQIGAIALQAIVVAAFSRHDPAGTVALIAHPLLPAKLFRWWPIGQPALVAYLVAIGVT